MLDNKNKVYLCRICGKVTHSDNGNQPLVCGHCNATSIFLQSKPQVVTKEIPNVSAS